MITDIITILWKEWQEILGGVSGRSRWSPLIFIGVFGLFMPLQFGRMWVESPTMLLYWAWVPLFMVNAVVADSFAGERERHTLETLLATRLSDQAILWGKIAAAISYGVGISWLSLLVGLVTLNLSEGAGELLLFAPDIAVSILVFSLLSSGLAAGVGVIVSLRATTVRQAQQTLSIAVMILLFVPIFGLRQLPVAWTARLLQTLNEVGIMPIIGIVALVLLLLDVALFAAALARFRRARLILD